MNATEKQIVEELFEKCEEPEEETTKVASHERRSSSHKGKDKITYPDNLPVERIELDLPEEKKTCPITGTPLVKIGDHLPLYRISEILSRNGIGISRQLLSQWVVKIGQALTPLYDLMLERVLQSGNIFVYYTLMLRNAFTLNTRGRSRMR